MPESNALSDGQIAAITEAANDAEIEQAKVAQDKAKDPRVKQFAAMMIQDHTQAKQNQTDMMSRMSLAPSESSQSQQLATDSFDTLSKLRDADKSTFDMTYMDAQVNNHQMVLDLLDNVLIPNAQNGELKKQLQDMKPIVEKHLTEARDIRQSLASKTGTGSMDTKRGTSGRSGGTGTGTSSGSSSPNGNNGSSSGTTPGSRSGGY
jgi:putative membrane protein